MHDTKQILWANVSNLMTHHWGKENLSELSRRAKIGLDPSNPPVIWLTQTERDLYENMRNAARKLVEIAH